MPTLNKKIVEEFHGLCSAAYSSWYIRRYLFDENPDFELLKQPPYAGLFFRLHEIIQEHWLLQLAKLHDPAQQQGKFNLTINYIIEYGGWDVETADKLKHLRDEMISLSASIRGARHKTLSHNDLDSILAGAVLGQFEKDQDVKYFADLQSFSNIVSEKVTGAPVPFDNFVARDINEFMRGLRNIRSVGDKPSLLTRIRDYLLRLFR